MTVTPEDLLQLAKRLLSDEGPEVAFRSATSRAYYAAFHSARERADELCPTVDRAEVRGGSHEVIVHRYIKRNDMAARSIAYQLRDLKAKRELADYELRMPWSIAESKTHVASAEKLINRIAELT